MQDHQHNAQVTYMHIRDRASLPTVLVSWRPSHSPHLTSRVVAFVWRGLSCGSNVYGDYNDKGVQDSLDGDDSGAVSPNVLKRANGELMRVANYDVVVQTLKGCADVINVATQECQFLFPLVHCVSFVLLCVCIECLRHH